MSPSYSVGGPGLTLYQNDSGFGYGTHGVHALCRWDPAPHCRPGDDYVRRIISTVLAGSAPGRRISVLLLGLGCGSAAAGILRGGSAEIDALDAVELSTAVIAIARDRFLPSMDSCVKKANATAITRRLRIVHADALRPHTWPRGTAGYTHIIVDVPQVYLGPSHPDVTPRFWASLGRIGAASGASIIVNSWLKRQTSLRNDLIYAGWGVVRTAIAGQNTVVVSSDWRAPYHPSRWSRWLLMRYHLRVNETALTLAMVLNLLAACACACWCLCNTALPCLLYTHRYSHRYQAASTR